ncbi:MAG: hypothetical protein ACXWF8_09820 [Methylobacter sp.]
MTSIVAPTPVFLSQIIFIASNAGALYGVELGYANMTKYVSEAGSNIDAFLNSVYAGSAGTVPNATVADVLIGNLGIVDNAAAAYAKDYIVGQLNSVAYAERGAIVNTILNTFSNLTSDPDYGAYATAWNAKISNAVAYASVLGNPDIGVIVDYVGMPVSTQTIIARNAGALYGIKLGYTGMARSVSQASSNIDAFLNSVYTNSVGTYSTATVADVLITTLGIVDNAAAAYAKNNIVEQLNSVAYTERGAMVNTILNTFSNITSDPTYGAYATAWNSKISNAVAYARVPGNDIPGDMIDYVETGTSTMATLELIGVADSGSFDNGNFI